MKRFLKGLVPFVLILGILASIFWYLLVYDREFTRDMLIAQARHLDAAGKADFAAKLYDLAYDYTGKDEDVAIELANQYRNDGNYTKAEYTLTNAIADGGSVELYTALSKTYVEQDKLQDAVAMLDSIPDPRIRAEMDQLRPAAPQAVPEPGYYNKYIQVEFITSSGKLYYTTNREYPSTANAPFAEPMTLPGGETVIYAVSVDSNGLVSPLTIVAYTVGGVIEEAVFADPAIELAVRQLLEIPEDEILMTDRLWEITEFTVPEDAQVLTDLSLMPYLEKLTIQDFKFENLSILAPLTYLKELDLSGSRFPAAELKTLAGLPVLEKLVLSQCGLSTIADLAGAMNLKYLDLSSNTLRNLEPLIPMTTLEELYLQHNAVTNLDALSALSRLAKLDISYNSVTLLSPLSKCAVISWVNAGHNSISSLNGMDAFTGLTYLDLSYNLLEDVEILKNCTTLTELNISNNNIEYIEPLGALSKLEVFNFSHNRVVRFPVWPDDSPMRTIDGSHNKLTAVTRLHNLMELTYLFVDYNEIVDLDPIAVCYRLVQVNAYGNEIYDVSALTDRNIIVNYDPTK